MADRMNLDHKLNSPLDSLIRKNKDHKDHKEYKKRSIGGERSGGDKREACRDYIRGECTRGAACPYSHDKNTPKDPCRDFLRGSCTRGKDCPYSHKVPGDVCRDYLLRYVTFIILYVAFVVLLLDFQHV